MLKKIRIRFCRLRTSGLDFIRSINDFRKRAHTFFSERVHGDRLQYIFIGYAEIAAQHEGCRASVQQRRLLRFKRRNRFSVLTGECRDFFLAHVFTHIMRNACKIAARSVQSVFFAKSGSGFGDAQRMLVALFC